MNATRNFLILLVVFVLLLFTSERLPLVWDEGEYIDRAEKHVTDRWEGHPYGFVAVIAAGKYIAPKFLSEKTQFRFGPILLVAISLGAVFQCVAIHANSLAGFFAVLCILLTPRLFADLHFASCDSVLIGSWLLFWAAVQISPRKLHGILFGGFFLGLTLSAKFTGWAALLPFCAFALLRPDKHIFGDCLRLCVAAVTFYLLNPPMWAQPFDWLAAFFYKNLHRSEYNISVLFCGEMYNLDNPLPVYNTLLWTAITVPIGILIFSIIGVFRLHSKRLFLYSSCYGKYSEIPEGKYGKPATTGVYGAGRAAVHTDFGIFTLFVLMNAAVLLIIRAIPGTPPHDGVRLFVPAFAFIAILAGLGAERLFVKGKQYAMCVLLIFAVSGFNLFWYAPQWLSFYNVAVYGLSGATKIGFEPTYYWDGLDFEVLDWLNENVAEDETVKFSASSRKTLNLYKRWGLLKPQMAANGDYYVLQKRPSGISAEDEKLIANKKPIFVKCIRKSGFGPWDLSGVPIIEVYVVKP